ncbi:MAG: alpha/beta hydrolase [Betaproteobacteria bacterium]|nr:MAG: alpha/beta hydrolase [Betaproteobacteria bacterium]
MKTNSSIFLDIRGLRYHCRIWGEADQPKLFMLHGWMDVSASFQFLVDALQADWHVIAPDWRGYGLSAWGPADSYWFPDYMGDLDRLLAHFEPDRPVALVGHSMGGNIASMYAGVRPERVSRLVNLEGFGMSRTEPAKAPERYAKWLAQLADKPGFRDYADFNELAARMRAGNPRLSEARALYLAQHWGGQNAAGRVELRSDPAHRMINPVAYQLEEAMACWRNVAAPVMWIDGAESKTMERMRINGDDHEARKACFRNLSAHTVAEAGHMLHHDQPERLAELIGTFLRRT